MLRHLCVQNLALLSEVRLDFCGGMTAITGESGAGKSMLLESFDLLAGGRGNPGLVSAGADRAAIEAIVELPPSSPALALIQEAGIATEDGELILRREISAAGRSRAWVNGRLVPVTLLKEIGPHLLDINGQRDQLHLLDAAWQRDFFDRFAGLEPRRMEVEGLHAAAKEAAMALAQLDGDEFARQRRAAVLQNEIAELESAELESGELAQLAQKEQSLKRLEESARAAGEVAAALEESGADGLSTLDRIAQALAACRRLAESDDAFPPAEDAIREAQTRLHDAMNLIGGLLSSSDASPEEIDRVIGRTEKLRRLMRRYGPTEEDALRFLEHAREEFDQLTNWEEHRTDARAHCESATEKLRAAALRLSAERRGKSEQFARALGGLLSDFSLPKAEIRINFGEVKQGIDLGAETCGPHGLETIEFLFTANAGQEPRPLARIASGGELSRLMLALRTLEGNSAAQPTLIFDEVDAGLSGTAARVVAERLSALGANSQLICVTHNPSVAAAADAHIVLEKSEEAGRTVSRADQVLGIARQRELARLLDGGKRSARGLDLAAELLRDTA